MNAGRARRVFDGSDGAVTRALYSDLEAAGPAGVVAMNLFRAQKCSARAKVYRGGIRGQGSYKSMAYDRKNWSMDNLCKVLGVHAAALGIGWGWKLDPAQAYHSWVMYVDLPGFGQVSFHSAGRGAGPDYAGEWDRKHESESRIIAYCDQVLNLVDHSAGRIDHASGMVAP